MKLYKTTHSNILDHNGIFYEIAEGWDELVNKNDLHGYLLQYIHLFKIIEKEQALQRIEKELLAPIGRQEVWAAGVTYLRSREARMEESKTSGGADLYDRVYEAKRPELFFKASAHRVVGHGQPVNIRSDSEWNVPEPELTLFINSTGRIQAYTIGNDMSSRSIEGENALYLPQAKVYERSAALGPCLYILSDPIDTDTEIEMIISRNNRNVYRDAVKISKMKRTLPELAEYLYRECEFQYGSFLMTGTCLVPPNDFTLKEDDRVDISITGIGTLSNIIAYKKSFNSTTQDSFI